MLKRNYLLSSTCVLYCTLTLAEALKHPTTTGPAMSLQPFSSPRRLSKQDVLGNCAVLLETIQDASAAVSVIPLLGSVMGATISLIRTVERVQGLQERSIRLGKRAADLMKHVHDAVSHDLEAVDDYLLANLRSLTDTLTAIRDGIEKEKNMTWVSRFLRHQSLSDAFDNHMETLDIAWRSFDTCCLINLRQRLETQSQQSLQLTIRVGELVHHVQMSSSYDAQQLRLFRWHDVRLNKPRGPWNLSDVANGTEFEGEWSGRTVAVRVFDEDSSCQDPAQLMDCVVRVSPLLSRVSQIVNAETIAQIFGYSHPHVWERFYVMEIGCRPLSTSLDIPDPRRRFRILLQTLADYDNAMQYAISLRLPWKNRFVAHGSVSNPSSWKSQWLPSASLRENGSLIVAIEDLLEHGPYGMFKLWSFIYDDETAWVRPSTDPSDTQSNIRSLFLAFVDPDLSRDIDWRRWRSRGDLLSVGDAALGDYGYVSTLGGGTKTFVRLGDIRGLLEADPRYVDGVVEFSEDLNAAPIRISVANGNAHECATLTYLVSMKDWCMDVYWGNLLQIATTHKVALHDFVLVHEAECTAQLSVTNGCTLKSCRLDPLLREDASIQICEEYRSPPSHQYWRCSSEDLLPPYSECAGSGSVVSHFFFHRLADGGLVDKSSPWGYWSLDPHPCRGPWPKLEVPGIQTHCSVSYGSMRLPRPLSDFFEFCHQQQTLSRRRSQTWLHRNVFSDEVEAALGEVTTDTLTL